MQQRLVMRVKSLATNPAMQRDLLMHSAIERAANACKSLYERSINALLRLHEVSIKALLRLY